MDDPSLPCCEDVSDEERDSLPPKAVDALLSIVAELNTAQVLADQFIEELTASVSSDLGGALSIANSVADELVGQLDIELSEQENRAAKVFTAVLQASDKELNQAVNWGLDAGFNIPYLAAEQQQLMQGDWLDMLMSAAPQFAGAMGVAPGPVMGMAPGPVMGGANSVGNVCAILPDPVTGQPVSQCWTGDPNNPMPMAPAMPPAMPPAAPPAAPPVDPVPVGWTGQLTMHCRVDANGNNTGDCWYDPKPGDFIAQPVRPIDRPQVGVPLPPGVVGVYPPNRPPARPGGLPGGAPILWPGQPAPVNHPPYLPPPPPPSPPSYSPPPPPAAPSSCPAPVVQCPAPVINFTCPDPQPLPPPPPPASGLTTPGFTLGQGVSVPGAVNWNDPAACKHAHDTVTAPLAPGAGLHFSGFADTFTMLAEGYTSAPGITKNYKDLFGNEELWDAFKKGVSGSANAATMATDLVFGQASKNVAGRLVMPSAVPHQAAAQLYGSRLAMANQVEKRTGFPMEYLYTADRLLFQFANPQEIPNQVRVDDAFLAGHISEDLWVCWTKANGNLPEPARRVMLSHQRKPGLGEIIQLWRRGHMTEDVLHKRGRELGILDPSYLNEWKEITKQLPTQSDLIRFMVRDAADERVAKEYEYDKGFTDKFTPQIKAWATSLGLDETYFKYDWRAHWQVPSYTQLREMNFRLRPDRSEVKAWDESAALIGAGATELAKGPRPPVVTLDEVKEALEVNDLAPRWVDPQIAVSYLPINRTDAVRAYQIGAFTESRLREAFLDVGYSPTDADTLLRFHSQDKARKRANVTGTWSPRKITSYYRRGYLTRSKAEELLKPLTADYAEVRRTLDAADDEVAADTRAQAVKGVRRGYMAGEFDTRGTEQALINFGVSPVQAGQLVTIWTIERDTRFKTLSATQAADMLKKGLISAEELRRRLRNLGYVPRDADLILARAMKVEGESDGLTASELDAAITETIKTRKEASAKSDSVLVNRLRQLFKEQVRIIKEMNTRREAEGKEALPMPSGPP
jgi:hypothetical protein